LLKQNWGAHRLWATVSFPGPCKIIKLDAPFGHAPHGQYFKSPADGKVITEVCAAAANVPIWRIETLEEVVLLKNGGILQYALRDLSA
jgi:hypothetical protein